MNHEKNFKRLYVARSNSFLNRYFQFFFYLPNRITQPVNIYIYIYIQKLCVCLCVFYYFFYSLSLSLSLSL
ncbi:hypothetical protein OAV88_03270 [bacterium]|nr:hypothetical protein [bacterium]